MSYGKNEKNSKVLGGSLISRGWTQYFFKKNKKGFTQHQSSGAEFTLVELLIVIAIIAVLAAVAIPQFVGMIDRARDAAIAAEMRTAATKAVIIEADNESFATVNCDATGDAIIQTICGSITANSPGAPISFAADNEFCISAQLNHPAGTTDHWCIDHTGFSGRVTGVQCGANIGGVPQIRCAYAAVQYTLTVTPLTEDYGTVVSILPVSTPPLIDCGLDCDAIVNQGTQITLRATPGWNSTFTGWSGVGITCPGTGDCIVTMNEAKTVTANFEYSGGWGLY